MKLEQHVCSLDLAKRLKELGVKQESLFWWGEITKEVHYCKAGKPLHISAFTVAELGEMLPKWRPRIGNFDYCHYETRNDQWEVIVVQDRRKCNDPCCKWGLCVPGTGIRSVRSSAVS